MDGDRAIRYGAYLSVRVDTHACIGTPTRRFGLLRRLKAQCGTKFVHPDRRVWLRSATSRSISTSTTIALRLSRIITKQFEVESVWLTFLAPYHFSDQMCVTIGVRQSSVNRP